MVKKRHCNVQRLDSKIMGNFGLENNTSCDLFKCSGICIKEKPITTTTITTTKNMPKKEGRRSVLKNYF